MRRAETKKLTSRNRTLRLVVKRLSPTVNVSNKIKLARTRGMDIHEIVPKKSTGMRYKRNARKKWMKLDRMMEIGMTA